MKIAIPHWQSRVSPVCDEARHFLVVHVADGVEVSRSEWELTLPGSDPLGRAARLLDIGVNTVICAAISQALESMLLGIGIRVIPQVCGNVEEVLQAYCAGTLDQDRFHMPGCGRRQRHRRRDEGRWKDACP